MNATQLEHLREICRNAVCVMEELIDEAQRDESGPRVQRYIKRVDKSVFTIKLGLKMLKKANRKHRGD